MTPGSEDYDRSEASGKRSGRLNLTWLEADAQNVEVGFGRKGVKGGESIKPASPQ